MLKSSPVYIVEDSNIFTTIDIILILSMFTNRPTQIYMDLLYD